MRWRGAVAEKEEGPCSLEQSPSKPRRRPTLPQSSPCSTIGPGELNFRVRDGNGCDLSGIAAKKKIEVRMRDVNVFASTFEPNRLGCERIRARPDQLPANRQHSGSNYRRTREKKKGGQAARPISTG
jgi:hypothetical protein